MKVQKEKLGQMILLGLDIDNINNEIIKIIEDYKIGGIILYKKNYHDIPSMISFINKLKEINKDNIPLFISIDQENGRVNRLPNDILRISSPLKQTKSGIDTINKVNDITTSILKNLGINMNFAPVVDINRSKDDGIVGDRGYGNNYKEVCKNAIPVMKKMKENNIISVIKHFPGHGASNKDSHIFIPKIKNVNLLLNNDLKVYEEFIKNDADAIMIGHLKISGYGIFPATLNKKIIQELLIDKYNYKGLIITDDLVMNTIKYIYGIKNAIIKSINAGNNLIMIKYRKGDYKLYNKLFQKDYTPSEIELIENSYNKIIMMKNKYHIKNNKISNNLDIDNLNKKISNINDLINQKKES